MIGRNPMIKRKANYAKKTNVKKIVTIYKKELRLGGKITKHIATFYVLFN